MWTLSRWRVTCVLQWYIAGLFTRFSVLVRHCQMACEANILNRHAFPNHALAKSQDFGTPMSLCEVCFQILRCHGSSSGLKSHWTVASLLNFVFLSALALILSWKSYIVPNRGLKEPSLLREKVKRSKEPHTDLGLSPLSTYCSSSFQLPQTIRGDPWGEPSELLLMLI